MANLNFVDRNVPAISYIAQGGLAGKSLTRLSAARNTAFAVTSDGALFAWGQYYATAVTNYAPIQVDTASLSSSFVIDVAASSKSINYLSALILCSDGAVYGSGVNVDSMLGDGNNTNTVHGTFVRSVEVDKLNVRGETVTKVIGGAGNGYATTNFGRILVWGSNLYRQRGSAGLPATTANVLYNGNREYLAPILSDKSNYLSTYATCTTPPAFYSDPTLCYSASQLYFIGNNSYFTGDNTTTTKLFISSVPSINGNIVQIAASEVIVVRTSNNLLYSWGYSPTNTHAQPSALVSTPTLINITGTPLAAKAFISLSCAYRHCLLLTSDNYIYGWGDNAYRQLGDSTTTQRSTPVEMTNYGAMSSRLISYVKTSPDNSFAVTQDGTHFSWGRNNNGLAGVGSITVQRNAVAANNLAGKRVTQIAPSYIVTFIITEDNLVYGWGNVLPNLPTSPELQNTTLIGNKTFIKIASTSGTSTIYSALLLCGDGTIYGIGHNHKYQLGDNNTAVRYAFTYTTNVFASFLPGEIANNVSLTNTFSAIVTTNLGRVLAWGDNQFGQLNTGSTNSLMIPNVLYYGNNAKLAPMISEYYGAGYFVFGTCVSPAPPLAVSVRVVSNTCSSTTWLYGIGLNTGYELGNSKAASPGNLVPVNRTNIGASSILEIAGGDAVTVVRTTTGLFSFGRDSSALGYGNTNGATEPKQVVTLGTPLENKAIQSVKCGSAHCIACTADNVVAGWGRNTYGQLGINSTTDQLLPTAMILSAVKNNRPVSSIEAASFNSYIITLDGYIFACGSNSNYTIGDGSSIPSATLVPITSSLFSSTSVQKLTAAMLSVFVLTTSNTIVCWGKGYSPLASNPTAISMSAFQNKTVVDISTSMSSSYISFTLALCSDGSIYGMGSNNKYQLGDGTTTTRTGFVLASAVPTVLSAGESITRIVAGLSNALITTSNGRVLQWGDNTYQQLGVSTTAAQMYPVELYAGNAYNMAPIVLDKLTSYTIISTCYVIPAKKRTAANVCTTGTQIYGLGSNTQYQLGDGTNIQRSVGTPLNMSLFQSDTAIVEAVGAVNTVIVRTSSGKLYA